MRRQRRRGFTLIEVTVVLLIIVLLAAMVVPNIDAMYGDVRLAAAVDQVRARWADARALAVEQGRAYAFGIVPDKNALRIAPDTPDYWGGNGAADNEDDTATGTPVTLDESLPRGVRFTNGDAGQAGQAGDPDAVPLTNADPEPVSASTAEWQRVVAFQPDGTADADVEIVFRARNARPLKLRLRALTGAVTVVALDPGS